MSVFDHIRGRKINQIASQDATYDDKNPGLFQDHPSSSEADDMSLEAKENKEVEQHPDEVSKNAHLGIQKAEAAALVWSKKAVYCTYAWIWLCFFSIAFQSSIQGVATQAAFGAFALAPGYATAIILANIVGGVLKLPIAKVLNIWGRAEALIIFFIVYEVGIIVIASAKGVTQYSAGYVLYWIGFDALYVILDIFIADTSGLSKRAFTFAFASTPYICTAFTGPLAGQAFLAHSTWQWAVGSFAIIQPFIFLPIVIVFKFYTRKAQRMGLFKREPSGRTTLQSIVHYFHEFDVVGAILLMAAFILFLLPFSLVTYKRITYQSGSFIAMVVIGFLLFFVFAAWEKWCARVHFVNYQLLKERTVIGACLMFAILYFSFYSWDNQFYNFVKVVYDLDITKAGYMLQIYSVGSTFWGVIFGLWVMYTKRIKYTCLFFALPLLILGAGLMIHFRGTESGIGYVVMCQIFIAFGGGNLVIGNEMAVMAAADREGVPMMLSMLYLFSSMGGAIGSAISSSVYYNTFQPALLQALPVKNATLAEQIYLGGYPLQQNYTVGSPTRDAINYAWGRTQYYNSITATAILALGFPAIAIWKNYYVGRKQNKGTMI